MITWKQFESAVFRYREIANYDQSYEEIMNDEYFTKSLMTNPNLKEMQKIIHFLNSWRCRVKSGIESENILLSVTIENLSLLNILKNYSIDSVNFDEVIYGHEFKLKVKDLVILVYSKFRDMDFKFGSTATTKLLHIFAPHLFVMWDKAIFNYYCGFDGNVSDSGPGYVNFLIIMKKLALIINNKFHLAKLNPSIQSKDPAAYLSIILNYKPYKTMAKLLDEFNWVTITNNA
jgi:hypothetical protein